MTAQTDEVLEDITPQPSFWQEPWVQNALPIVTSLVVHLGLILLGLLTYTAYKAATTVQQEQIIVPDAAIVAGDVGGIPNPGLGGDPTRPAASDMADPINARSDGWNKLPSKTLQAAVVGGSGDTSADTIIGIGAGQSLGKGKGSGVGSGDSDGAAAPFGVPGGGSGIGPKSKFMGVSGNAKSIVYFCDASGSMLGTRLDLLKIELKKAVDALVPIQSFNIIFFSGEDFQSFNKNLVTASPFHKQEAFKFIDDVIARSSTVPYKALQLAFSNKPELMYVLSDGFERIDSFDELVNQFSRYNANKATRVYTIGFFSPGEDDGERKLCENALDRIAKENGGKFKIVLTTDLMK